MALALLSAFSAAHAVELSGTVTATTDYDFRGVTQSAQNPALQGSLDLAADNGFYMGVWASNVEFGPGDPNLEVDYYAGWGGGETYPWDLGVTAYTYSGARDTNYYEAHAGVGWKYFEAKAWYAWDYAGYSGNERYIEGNVTYPLPANFGLTGHIGYTNGSAISDAYTNPETGDCQSSYMDWSVGVTYSWKHFDMSLKWVDGSDLKTMENGYPKYVEGSEMWKQTDNLSSEARAIFTVSTTFPWKDE